MTPQDRNAFLEVVIGFAELKGKQLSAPALELYWNAMRDWPLDEFKAAAQQLLRSCEFMPTPKDFEDLRRTLETSTTAEAWDQAQRFARSLYHPTGYRQGAMGNPAIDLAVQSLGGYPAIAMCDTDKLHFLERRFAERYAEQVDVQAARGVLPNLTPSTAKIAHDGPRKLGDILPNLQRPKREDAA